MNIKKELKLTESKIQENDEKIKQLQKMIKDIRKENKQLSGDIEGLKSLDILMRRGTEHA